MMFSSNEFWRSLVFLGIGGVITLLTVKLWDAQERERRLREERPSAKPRNIPQEHDERSC